MAEARNHATVEFSTTFTLTEVEIRALDALVGYGDTAFITHFKGSLGEAYIRNHEKGLRTFFSSVRQQVLPALHDIDTARRDLHDALAARVQAAEQQRLLIQQKNAEQKKDATP